MFPLPASSVESFDSVWSGGQEPGLQHLSLRVHSTLTACSVIKVTCPHARVPMGMLQASARELVLLLVATLSATVDVFAVDYLEEKKGQLRFSCELGEGQI